MSKIIIHPGGGQAEEIIMSLWGIRERSMFPTLIM